MSVRLGSEKNHPSSTLGLTTFTCSQIWREKTTVQPQLISEKPFSQVIQIIDKEKEIRYHQMLEVLTLIQYKVMTRKSNFFRGLLVPAAKAFFVIELTYLWLMNLISDFTYNRHWHKQPRGKGERVFEALIHTCCKDLTTLLFTSPLRRPSPSPADLEGLFSILTVGSLKAYLNLGSSGITLILLILLSLWKKIGCVNYKWNGDLKTQGITWTMDWIQW